MQRFVDLNVWQRSHKFVLAIYQATADFPNDERFGLISQVRRSAVSVPTNIAEGSKRKSRKDYARLLNIAEGSLAETEYLLMLSKDLGYLENDRRLRAVSLLVLQDLGFSVLHDRYAGVGGTKVDPDCSAHAGRLPLVPLLPGLRVARV